MALPFVESPRFPYCPSFGYVTDPEYRVVITRRASGVETRNRAWRYTLVKGTVTVGPRAEGEIQDLLKWWHACGGQAIGFRVQDYVDYKSCQVQFTPTALDQPLIEIPDTGLYQLTKRYEAGVDANSDPIYNLRPIYKPVVGTVVLSGAGSVDYTNGTVSGSSGGTWGGEFDLPMRFDSGFPVEILDQRIESVTFALQELRVNPITGETG
jgi:uncharacterized protein (TIGR02217 family)